MAKIKNDANFNDGTSVKLLNLHNKNKRCTVLGMDKNNQRLSISCDFSNLSDFVVGSLDVNETVFCNLKFEHPNEVTKKIATFNR